jgi:pyruvate formate lyase activating enzyme
LETEVREKAEEKSAANFTENSAERPEGRPAEGPAETPAEISEEKPAETAETNPGERGETGPLGQPAEEVREAYASPSGERVPVNKVIPFSSVDGPGSRTAVFLQECNIDCLYCHNPETRNLCVGCGRCVKTCPAGALSQPGKPGSRVLFDPAKCVACDTCIHVCAFGASPRIEYLTAAECYERVRRQIPFIRGVTVSGGECTMHPVFLTELFRLCRADGLTTLLDSNGMLDYSRFPELMEVTDGVMLDIKAFTAEDHRRVTGYGNEMVLKNAVWLAERGKLPEIRTVAVPCLFDVKGTVRSACRLLAPYSRTDGIHRNIRYKLISCRPNGVRKEYLPKLDFPSPEYMSELAETAREEGFTDIQVV